MAKGKSQWDFGELFPPEQTRNVVTVTELTAQVRRLLERQVGSVWVTGEISNLRLQQGSGHAYFTLKDAGAQLSCVLFRGEPVSHRELLQDGAKIIVQGDVTVYEARGQYQLIVRALEMQGVGALQAAFEKLKQKLQAEGLFAPERKRPLPVYVRRIGLVSSPTGAAIRDVLHVIRRRFAGLEIVFAPCRVQGDGAAREIAAAVRLLNEYSGSEADRRLDLVLVTRGGGSLEDLWAFNEEAVARAIFESTVPVVSAVGHEIDFTISDFVADLRAATPSAAAELITEGMFSSRVLVVDAAAAIRRLARRRLESDFQELDDWRQRLGRCHPKRRLELMKTEWKDAAGRLRRCAQQGLRQGRQALKTLVDRLVRARPAEQLRLRRETCGQIELRLRSAADRRRRELAARLELVRSRLALLGPEQVLARGYSITMDAESGRVLRVSEEVAAGRKIRTRLAKGEVVSRVEKQR
ncbi:MAG: exodeoxyribonuclease VII large subunit [Verrucomicrobiota bacterium]